LIASIRFDLNTNYARERMMDMAKSKTPSGHGGARAGAGRKPRSTEPADVIASLRLTASEYERYTRAAAAADMPFAEWLRAAADSAARRARP
jgi:hypothetical protein